jgi:hypothetical protein
MIANKVHLVSELAKLVLGVSSGVGLLLGLLWVVARAIDENKPFARRTSHEPPMTNNPPDSASVAPRRQTRFAQITSPDAVGAGPIRRKVRSALRTPMSAVTWRGSLRRGGRSCSARSRLLSPTGGSSWER